MIYVFPKGNVVYDGNTLTEAQKEKAVVVESLPEPQTPEGKYPVWGGLHLKMYRNHTKAN